ncbi:olfactory receptor 10G4-like [Chanos chanos]|uniref:Olfactory receptor 10G4-like n=1 Tax=Chanos chanos TaxID=29144 RepID=A0A6J2WV53_CHACN|nr:olfactory receptor 10G4-like [Chanos chanos]
MLSANATAAPVTQFIITGFDHLSNQKLLGSLILIAYFIALLGSTTNLVIIVTSRQLHTPMYILICNLAVVDIMFTTSASTTMISVLLTEIKSISYYSCFSRMYVYHLGGLTECLALSLMAVDRMVAISLPLRYHSILTVPRILLLIAFTWLIGILAMAAVAVIANNLPYCQPVIRYVFCDYPAMVRAACTDPEPAFVVPVILNLWLLAGQLPFILLTYMKIVYTVVRMPKGQMKTESQNAMFTTCVSHVTAVFCYYAPKLVSNLLTRVGVVLTLTERNALLIVATLVPPLLNPIVYCLKTKEIRIRLKNVLLNLRVSQVQQNS